MAEVAVVGAGVEDEADEDEEAAGVDEAGEAAVRGRSRNWRSSRVCVAAVFALLLNFMRSYDYCRLTCVMYCPSAEQSRATVIQRCRAMPTMCATPQEHCRLMCVCTVI